MKFTNSFGLLLIFFVGLSQIAQAQTTPETGSFGIRANLGGQSTIEVPYMFNKALSIAPYIGINATQNATTNFSIGVRPRYYLSGSEDLSLFATGLLGLQTTSFSNTNNSDLDVNLGAGFGAEYFFNSSFSLSGDANLNARVGDNSNNIGTIARVSVSYYF